MRLTLLPRASWALAFLLFAMTGLQSNPAAAGPWDADWKKVDEAVQKGLPKTAIEALQPIIDGTIKAKAYPEAIKAIAKKIALEGKIQGNKPEERITRMTAEIAKAPDEMKPVMTAILADWYWHYFQQNRWRFLHRTATVAPPGKDFTTWDLPRIFAEIDEQFTKALSNATELKAIPIGTYDALLEQRDRLRRATGRRCTISSPMTLWRFTRAASKPRRSRGRLRDLSADSPIFAPATSSSPGRPRRPTAIRPR